MKGDKDTFFSLQTNFKSLFKKIVKKKDFQKKFRLIFYKLAQCLSRTISQKTFHVLACLIQ
jgi:hypothetical protein